MSFLLRHRYLSISLILFMFPFSLQSEPFDRLDGTGKSQKRVDVIEWAGNIEVHVYPVNSLLGLAAKLDKGKRGGRVLVLGYRFDTAPSEHIVRRAILGIDLKNDLKAYKDTTVTEYDKVLVTNSALGGTLAEMKLEKFKSEPTEMLAAETPGKYPNDQSSNRNPATGAGYSPYEPIKSMIDEADHEIKTYDLDAGFR